MYDHKDSLKAEPNFGMEFVISHRLLSVNTNKFTIHFFNSLTNIKIILFTSPGVTEVEDKLKKVYRMYSEFVRNNWKYMVF